MRHRTIPLAVLAATILLLGACVAPAAPAPAPQPTTATIANPASENCIKQGGTLQIETRGDGGQYGVCTFEDNRQCEEWALLRGDCPVGGLKVTGFITPAAQYCAITGGTYVTTGNSGQDDEQGACTFNNGAQCDAWDYYDGACDSATGAAAAITTTVTSTTSIAPITSPPAEGEALQPLDEATCTELAQAMAETLGVEVTRSDVPFADPTTGASGTACEALAVGTGEQYSSPDTAVNELAAMLEAEGWQEDPMLASGGPTGFGEGFRKDAQMCMAVALWWPDASANCPKDQPISACEVTPAQQLYTVTLDCAQLAARTAAPEGWLTYANPLGFSISYPATWTAQQLPAQAQDTLFAEALQGTEGEVELQWGVGFGGACPQGYTTVQVAQGELPTCYAKNADGTESWTQINKDLEATSFSANARTNNADSASHDLVLQVLSTLAFMPPTTSEEPEASAAITTAVTTTVASTTALVPLKDAVATMDPQDVWQNFYDLTQVPRPSHHEEQVRDFLVQFGQGLGLETIVDDVGNVLIRKPASPGMENRAGVVLQAHMDMVPQKTPDSTHDFLADPIDAYVDGDWVVADQTTLGADDGIGAAIAMAVLQSDAPALGPVEGLFTVNEEDGMDGALGLQPGWLQGTILINLDSEDEGVFTIGSAGGDYFGIDTAYAEVASPAATTAYTVTVSGLQGGHSGVDIDKNRGHATKLLVRLLSPASQQFGLRLAQIGGGTAANAITTHASALVLVPDDQVDAFLQYVRQFQGIVQSELAAVEPDLVVQATPAPIPAMVMDPRVQRGMIDALYGTPQGVVRMSDAVPGLVETSTNMGIVDAAEGTLAVTCLSRSSVDTALDDVNQMIGSVWDLAGVPITVTGRYSGWDPNPDSPILLLMEDVYENMYGVPPEVTAIHAGLECGTIASKYPGMDAISIGPTLQNVHTPNERLQIATVKKLNDFLLETLQQIPEQAATEAAQPATTEPLSPTVDLSPSATVTATQLVTYTPGPPPGEPQEGSCWTSSLAVWRDDAWRCSVGNSVYDPCFSVDGGVVCGASPVTSTVGFALTLTEPLPTPEVPADTSGHAWLVELADGTICEFATGATGGVGDERINYFCPSADPSQPAVILGDLQESAVWTAHWAVLAGEMPNLTVVESVQTPIRVVWR